MVSKFLIRTFLASLLLTCAGTASAAQDCRQIEDPEARLACFDALYPQQNQKADDVESDNILGPFLDEEAEADLVEEKTTVTPSRPEQEPVEKKSKKQKKEKKKKGFLSLGDKQHYEGSIVEMLNKPQQRMVFRLDNDEIWIQTTPRNLPIKVGDKVTIRRGTVGGYILRTENNVSTRISQIPDE